MNYLRKNTIAVYGFCRGYLAKIQFSLMKVIYPKYTKEAWENEYAGGRWDCLQDVSSFAKLGVVSAYAHFFKKNGYILDVCCGSGNLAKILGVSEFVKYTGIDVSDIAIQQAEKFAGKKENYICCDANTYITNDKYDVITFTDSLYYFTDPIDIIRKYNDFLQPDGVFVIVMFETMRSKPIWALLELNYKIIDTTILYHPDKKLFFRISVLRVFD